MRAVLPSFDGYIMSGLVGRRIATQIRKDKRKKKCMLFILVPYREFISPVINSILIYSGARSLVLMFRLNSRKWIILCYPVLYWCRCPEIGTSSSIRPN
jgi:hypothetical protein